MLQVEREGRQRDGKDMMPSTQALTQPMEKMEAGASHEHSTAGGAGQALARMGDKQASFLIMGGFQTEQLAASVEIATRNSYDPLLPAGAPWCQGTTKMAPPVGSSTGEGPPNG